MPIKIYCPKCHWKPDPQDHWMCACGHSWHTFSTYGKCPACSKVWRDTQCLACHQWSKHHDWYHDMPPVQVESILEKSPAELSKS